MDFVLITINTAKALTAPQAGLLDGASRGFPVGPLKFAACRCSRNCGSGSMEFVMKAESLGKGALKAEQFLHAWAVSSLGIEVICIRAMPLKVEEAVYLLKLGYRASVSRESREGAEAMRILAEEDIDGILEKILSENELE